MNRVDHTAGAQPSGLLPGSRAALVAACTVVVLLGARIAAPIIAPILLAFVLTTAISPLLTWQVRRGLPTPVAYTTTLIATFALGAFVVLLLTASLVSFAETLPTYRDAMQPYLQALADFFNRLGIRLDELFTFKNIEPGAIVKSGLSAANRVTDLLSGLALVGFVTVFMLLETTTFARKLVRVPASIGRLAGELRGFVKVTAYLGAAAALLEVVLLLALGVPNAFLWGLLSFFLSFLPYIGFVLALIPPALLALLTGGVVPALIVVAGYVGINAVSDNIVKPRVMGTETDLSPLAVFLSLVLWGWVLGPLGGLLAVPITLIVKGLILEAYPEWRWLAALLGTPPAAEAGETEAAAAAE